MPHRLIYLKAFLQFSLQCSMRPSLRYARSPPNKLRLRITTTYLSSLHQNQAGPCVTTVQTRFTENMYLAAVARAYCLVHARLFRVSYRNLG